MTDEQLQADVVAELFWDPRVGSEAIAVSADAGTVTLRGTVDSFREVREAGKAACRVYGVTRVCNELDVRLLDDSKRDDAELRGDVLQALMLDSLIPTTVNVRARNGSVTLSGTADWQYQRDEAEFLAASVPGVYALQNHIRLTPAPDTGDVRKDISEAFRRNASLDAGPAFRRYHVLRTGGPRGHGELVGRARRGAWTPPGPTRRSPRSMTRSW